MSLPTNLHVTHDWGGGVTTWVEDFATADSISRNLVLSSFGTADCYGIGLRLTDAGSGAHLGSWVLADPVSEVRAAHSEHAAILREVCRAFQIDHVYVSSLVGHAFGVFAAGPPCTFVHHDYFPWCPAFYVTRDAPCVRCEAGDLEACRETPSGLRPKASPRFHLGMRDAFFAARAAADVQHVAPSESVARTLRRLDPRFGDVPFTVIEHGLPNRRRDCFGGASAGRRLRVGLLGKVAWHKGADALRRGFASWRAVCDLFLVGAGDAGAELAGRWGVQVIPRYERRRLPSLLWDLGLDLVLLLHVVPETFSYTLSETWSCCIPPASRRLGAPVERIADGVDGFLLDLEERAVLDFLLAVDRERETLRRVADRLRTRPVRTAEEEVAAYYRLRGDLHGLVDRRLAAATTRGTTAS